MRWLLLRLHNHERVSTIRDNYFGASFGGGFLHQAGKNGEIDHPFPV